MAAKVIGEDRSSQRCLRVTPTLLCNHNNHNSANSTSNQGQESNKPPPDSPKGIGKGDWSDVQAACSVSSVRRSSMDPLCAHVKASILCFTPQTHRALSLSPWYIYNSCTVSASPSSSCSPVMEPVAFMACGLGGREDGASAAGRFQPSTIFPLAITALSKCV